MSKRRRPPVPAVAVVVLLLLVGVGVWWWLDRPTPDEERRVSGSVETTRYQVAATISGQVAEVLVSEGDTVKAGDPLVRLDEKPLKLAVDQASAGVDAAKALVRQKQEDGTKAEVAEAKARETQAKAGLNLAKTQLGYATLKAPTTGSSSPSPPTRGRRPPRTHPGHALRPGRRLGPGVRPRATARVDQVGRRCASPRTAPPTSTARSPGSRPNPIHPQRRGDQGPARPAGLRIPRPAASPASGFLPGQPVDVTLP